MEIEDFDKKKVDITASELLEKLGFGGFDLEDIQSEGNQYNIWKVTFHLKKPKEVPDVIKD